MGRPVACAGLSSSLVRTNKIREGAALEAAAGQGPALQGQGPQYWRSLDQLADTPEFREWMHREFPKGASEMMDGASRRSMLKIMAASFGLAGLAACSRRIVAASGDESIKS